jgi:hypothetical protein
VQLTDCANSNCDYLAVCLVTVAPSQDIIGISRVRVEVPKRDSGSVVDAAAVPIAEDAICAAIARQEQFGIVRASPSRSCEGFEWLFRGLYPGPAEIGIRRVATGTCDDYVLIDQLKADATTEASISWSTPDGGAVSRKSCPPCGDDIEHPERLSCSDPACVFDPQCIEPDEAVDEPPVPEAPSTSLLVAFPCEPPDASIDSIVDASATTIADASADVVTSQPCAPGELQ